MNPKISSANLFRIAGLGLALLAFTVPVGVRAQQTPRYSIIDLGAVGGAPGQPITVKNNGLISGQAAAIDGSEQALLWFHGMRADIGKPGLGGKNNIGFGVNESGQVTGSAETVVADPYGEDFCGFQFLGFSSSPTVCAPYLWHNGVMTALPTLGGHNGAGNQVNNRGVIAGVAETSNVDPDCAAPQKLQFKPVTWQDGQIRELSTYGDPDGIAFAINDSGQAVGASGSCGPFNPATYVYLAPVHALLWENGAVTDLRSLGGEFGNVALGLNNLGHAVGGSDIRGDSTSHAFLWTRNTGMQDLGTLDGDIFSTAIGINDADQIVGVSADPAFNIRAFVRVNGQMHDLNSRVAGSTPLYLLLGCSVNASGQIIGLAFDTATNELHGYLATPDYTAVAQNSAAALPLATQIALAQNVRNLLQQLHLGRFAGHSVKPR